MIFSSRNLCIALSACASVASLVVACGSDSDSTFNDGNVNPQFSDGGGFNNDAQGTQDDLYKNDPLPKYCGPEAGSASTPPPVTGTEDCPDDKNKPGCYCDPTKDQGPHPCWTGLRKNRSLGQCKDGTTTCQQKSENTWQWGACEGEVLPDPNATNGPAACRCFTQGQWKITNLSPCVAGYQPTAGDPFTYTGVSTVDCSMDTCASMATTGYGCMTQSGPTAKPSTNWSTDTLTVDCAGTFTLKYRIKVGDFNNPQPGDCTLGEVELDPQYYPTPNVEMPWQVLKPWIGTDTACAKKWHDTPEGVSPGYGEMIVKGESVLCDEIDDGKGGDFVFNRIQYCPTSCNSNPSGAGCAACQASGQGTFK